MSNLKYAPAISREPQSILTLENIEFSLKNHLGTTPILHNINLNIHQNKRVAIIGPSGSGKTSLLMIMAGLERPSAGMVSINGQQIHNLSDDALADFRAKHIGIVFQSFHLMSTLTALENVAIPLKFLKDPQAYIKAEATLASLGLSHRLHHYPSELSGGEQQRVGIARACVMQPSLLLADEPTGNLDHETGAEVIKVLFDMQQKQGTTLLLVTHDMELAKSCDEIIHIQDGRIHTP